MKLYRARTAEEKPIPDLPSKFDTPKWSYALKGRGWVFRQGCNAH